MIRNLIVLGVCLIVLLAAGPIRAESRLRATVDRTQVAPGESIYLTVTVTGGEAEVDTSAITDFGVYPRGTSSRFQIVDGRTSRQVDYSYLLVVRHQGDLVIPALSAEIDGRTYYTDPIAINVSEQSKDDPADTGSDVFVTAAVSESQPYAGQQLIYTFSLYNAVQVTGARFQPPQFKGFIAREINDRRTYRKDVNGREYAVVEIDYVLVAMSPGQLTIEPALLQVGIVGQERRRTRSPFDDFFDSPFLNRGVVTPKTMQSQPLAVDVQPLPTYSGPGVFSGLVGQFEFSAAVENTRLQVGDSTTLTLTIRGNGNIMDAQAPIPEIPQGFKTYTDTPQEQIQLGHDGYSGQKVFRIALVPVQAGKFELPPLTFSYFDIAQGRYRTLETILPALYVTPAAPAESVPLLVTPQAPEESKKQVAFTGRDILPLKEEMGVLIPYRSLSPLVFFIWLMAPAGAFGILLFIQQVRRRDIRPRARMKAKARQALKAAQAVMPDSQEDPAGFLSYLYQALTASIFSAAGRSGEALTWKEAETMLTAGGLDQPAARRAAELLSAIESVKFSAGRITPEQARHMLADTRSLVRRLAP